jgi:hypothetical protein
MLSIATLTVIRVLHIVCAVFWVMASTILTLFVRPILSADATGRASFERVLRRWGMFILLSVASPVATATGIYLFVQRGFAMSGLDQIVLGIGAAAGLVGFVWGVAIIAPLGLRMTKALQQVEQSGDAAAAADLARIERQEHRAHYVMISLQWIGLIAMSAFRYL